MLHTAYDTGFSQVQTLLSEATMPELYVPNDKYDVVIT